jgi:hypothetical protein
MPIMEYIIHRGTYMLSIVLGFLLFSTAHAKNLVLEYSSSQVKLHNHDTLSVDISGWRMNGEKGFSHVFPSGTVIPARRFVVVETGARKGITVLNTSNEKIISCRALISPQAVVPKPPSTKPSIPRRLYARFDPKIRVNSNIAHPDQTTKIVEGVADQRFCEPLTVGLGGKWVKWPDETEAYVGLTDLKFSLTKFGNLSIHHQHLLRGIEKGDHPQKTILSWRIPAVLGLTLSLNREHRWSDEFKADINSVGVERPIGKDVVFYTKHCVQSFGSGLNNGQSMVGLRNIAAITKKLRLITSAELWRNARSDRVYHRTLGSSLQYYSSEFKRVMISVRANKSNHELNPIFQAAVMQPVVAGIHFGAKKDLNYHIPKENPNWYHFKRCAGIAYIRRHNSRWKLVGSASEIRTQGEYYWRVNSCKLIASPTRTAIVSLKYAYTDGRELGSAWVKYLHTYFELGVGGRALRSQETITHGLTVEGGIRRFPRLPFVCAYRVGYNIVPLDDQILVGPLHRNPCYYVKMVISPNSFEALFEEE